MVKYFNDSTRMSGKENSSVRYKLAETFKAMEQFLVVFY